MGLSEMNATELLASAALLMARAEGRPKGDPQIRSDEPTCVVSSFSG